MSYEGNNRAKRELAPTRTGREHAATYAILNIIILIIMMITIGLFMSEIFLSLSRIEKCAFPSESRTTPLHFRFSDGKQGDTTGFWSTVSVFFSDLI